MTPERPWARHYFDVWMERAGDPRFPPWLRVAALAYGSHLDNGHASFKRRQIALIVGRPGWPEPHVGRQIRVAVEYNWLAPGSWWGCLIVPRDAVRKGPYGSPKKCPRCEQHLAPNRPLRGRYAELDLPLRGRFGAGTDLSEVGSQRKPLSLIWPETATAHSPQGDNDTQPRQSGQEAGA